MSSASRSGISSRTCSVERPLAKRSRTSVTRIRIPRMQGRAPHCSGSTVIRSANSATTLAFCSELHCFCKNFPKTHKKIGFGAFLAVDTGGLFDPSDPPVIVLLQHRCIFCINKQSVRHLLAHG